MICVLVAPHRKQDLEFWYIFITCITPRIAKLDSWQSQMSHQYSQKTDAFQIASTCHTKCILTIIIFVALLQNGICSHSQFCINPSAFGHSNFSHPFMDIYRCNTPNWKERVLLCVCYLSHCYKLLMGDCTERTSREGRIYWTDCPQSQCLLKNPNCHLLLCSVDRSHGCHILKSWEQLLLSLFCRMHLGSSTHIT